MYFHFHFICSISWRPVSLNLVFQHLCQHCFWNLQPLFSMRLRRVVCHFTSSWVFLSAFTRWIIIHETILWFWVNGILDFFVFFGYLDKCSRDMLWNELFHLGINELVRDVTVRAYWWKKNHDLTECPGTQKRSLKFTKKMKLSPIYQYLTVKYLHKIWAVRILENCLIRNL